MQLSNTTLWALKPSVVDLIWWELVWSQQGFQIFDTILWLPLTLIAVINCAVSKLIRTKMSRIIAINQTNLPVPLNITITTSKFHYNFSFQSWKWWPKLGQLVNHFVLKFSNNFLYLSLLQLKIDRINISAKTVEDFYQYM